MAAEAVMDEVIESEDLGLQKSLLFVLAAWVVPGLGHILLSRTARGLIFGALVWGSFGFGLMHEGNLALRDSKQPFLTTLQIVANLGVGPADLVARMSVYGKPAYSMDSSPRKVGPITKLYRERIQSELAIYGTAFLWTAGLMNLLLLFDVWDIGRGRKL